MVNSDKKIVLCVISEDQYEEYQPEIQILLNNGAEVIFQESPDEALSQISEINPKIVIVGMEVEDYEGIELLALLTTRCPDFDGATVLLPDKEDGLPPIVHSRSQDTGHSAVDGVDFNFIATLLGPPLKVETGLDQSPSPFAGAAVNETASAPEIEDGSLDVPVDMTADTLLSDEVPVDLSSPLMGMETLPKKKKTVPLAMAAGAVLVIAIGGYFAFMGAEADQGPIASNETTQPQNPTAAGQSDDIDIASAEAQAEGQADEATAEGAAAQDPQQKAEADKQAQPVDEPMIIDEEEIDEKEIDETPTGQLPDLPTETVLPLRFKQGEGKAEVRDEDALNRLVMALKKQANMRIILTGHASIVGTAAVNYKLGLLRANGAKNILVRQGIPAQRIKVTSLGSRAAISEERSQEKLEKSRRVTITLQPM